jgi:hypothetical protein
VLLARVLAPALLLLPTRVLQTALSRQGCCAAAG